MAHNEAEGWNSWIDEYTAEGGKSLAPGNADLSAMIDIMVSETLDWTNLNFIEIPIKFIVINHVDTMPTVVTGYSAPYVVDAPDGDTNTNYVTVIASLNASIRSMGVKNVRFFAQDYTSVPYLSLKSDLTYYSDDSSIGADEMAKKLCLIHGDRNCLNVIINQYASDDSFINDGEFSYVYCKYVSAVKIADNSKYYFVELLANCLEAACGLFAGTSDVDRIDEEVSDGVTTNIMGDELGSNYGLNITQRQLARMHLAYEFYRNARGYRPYLQHDDVQTFDLITSTSYISGELSFTPTFTDVKGFIGFPQEYVIYGSVDGLSVKEISRYYVPTVENRVGASEVIAHQCDEYTYYSVQPIRKYSYSGLEIISETEWTDFTDETFDHDLHMVFVADLV